MNKNLLALLGIAPVLTDTSLPFWTEKTMYNERYETPNMERLARQGMMFTQAYASSISSPTRCSLMTGANAARHRVTNWTLQKNKTTDAQSEVLQLPDWNYNGIAQVEGTNHTFVAKSFVQYRGQVVRAVPERQRLPHHPLRKGTLGSHRHSGRESLPLRL